MSNTCIDMDMFTAYFGKYISRKERNRVENHLANCNECMNLFAIAAETLLDPEIYEYDPICKTKANDLWKSIRQRMKHFFQWSRNQSPPQWTYNACPSFQPIPVMVRADDSIIESESIAQEKSLPKSPVDCVYIEKDVDPFKVEIFAEHTRENSITCKIRVHTASQSSDDIFVYLERKDKGITAKPFINEYVLFENLPYDNYVIILEQEHLNKAYAEIEINQNGIHWKNEE
ncbi:MAG: hypothetical protein OMM_05260 [Candidatus Magnetoglobus multicellularis str. Araruama]|uniref:Zinc-finger domain-containing protein n=1 Tax=Candidatus Magnetoglobus multicellularis str. Araruama TaxID=890399 RepID=A0A1V1NXC4_9BACT|nr:MAG: hypothetical protein OMM_05260 [Candidatus Magnetoglobus multicellularis str. Araruama]